MGRIEIQFSEVMNLVKQLSDVTDKLGMLEKGQLQQILYDTKSAYYGESADLLAKKEVKVNAKILQEAEGLQSLSGELERRVKEMYLSESINQAIARTRIY